MLSIENNLINESVICIYHKKSKIFYCLDGIVSAYSLYLEGCHNFIAGTYYNDDEIISKIGNNNTIYIVDYSMSKEKLQLLAGTNKVIVNDHHKTAERNLSDIRNRNIKAIFDMSKSGAMLTNEYFSNCPAPAFIKYVQDGDLYKFELPDSKLVTAGLYTLAHHSLSEIEIFQAFDTIVNLSQDEIIALFKPIGILATEARNARIQQKINDAEKKILNNFYSCMAIEITAFDADITSSLGNSLYKQYTDVDCVVIYSYDDTSGKYFVSFRSDDKGSNFDCETIASKFGGGGHPNACGCQLNSMSEILS